MLYSGEFYEVIKKHLRKGGIMEEWFFNDPDDPAMRASTAKSLKRSFPYVRAFPSLGDSIYFLARMEPLPDTPAAVLASRLPPAAAADFIEYGPKQTPTDEFQFTLSREFNVDELIAKAPRVPPLTDDAPINEYFLLRRWFHYYR